MGLPYPPYGETRMPGFGWGPVAGSVHLYRTAAGFTKNMLAMYIETLLTIWFVLWLVKSTKILNSLSEKKDGDSARLSGGFIQIPILIAIIVSALLFGGGGYFIAHQIEKSQKAASEANSQATTTPPKEQTTITASDVEKLKNKVDELKKQQAAQVKTNTQTSVKTPPVSTQPIPPAPAVQDPVAVVATSTQEISNSKHFYQEGRMFVQGMEKVLEHNSASTNFLTQASNAIAAKNYGLAKSYAKSAVDALDAAYRANVDNTVPFDLPDELQNPMIKMRSISSERILLLKQTAEITKSAAEDMEYGGPSLATVESVHQIESIGEKASQLANEWMDVFSEWATLLESYNK
jgi:hypothetical protein